MATTPEIILRYTACAGLINQHYSHIAALTLAAALKASVVMPPAVRRDSYAKYFSIFKEKNEVEWTPAPLDTLLDVTKIAQTWAAKGITIQMVLPLPLLRCTALSSRDLQRVSYRQGIRVQAPALLPFPDMTEPEVAYPLYKQQEYDKKYTVRMHDVYMQVLACCRTAFCPCMLHQPGLCPPVTCTPAERDPGPAGEQSAQDRLPPCKAAAAAGQQRAKAAAVHRPGPALHILHAEHPRVCALFIPNVTCWAASSDEHSLP